MFIIMLFSHQDNMTNPSVPVMGYNVYSGKLRDIRFGDGQVVINTLNAYSYVKAEEDALFKKALQSSDILIADGFPVVLAARLLGGYKIMKIAGADIFFHILQWLNYSGGSCFFFGSAPETLARIENRIRKEFPEVKVSLYSPPYKDKYTALETEVMIQAINKPAPAVVFVGMTAPKQEKWVYENKAKLPSGIICSIGAVFDFYAGTVKRPGRIWVKMNLEWFIRFLKEPKRLAKRYFIYSPRFFRYFLMAWIRHRKHA
jgi:N-acetylglucosaminyldiphosphoundecaprenol N-acetyl-beta-D-mannosaminyltransferase